jgi:hypothetical protein
MKICVGHHNLWKSEKSVDDLSFVSFVSFVAKLFAPNSCPFIELRE